mgnify:CR=1 FL=1
MVLEVLDESKNGLIPKQEVTEAIKKIVYHNNLNIDNQALAVMVDSMYQGTNGNSISRKSIRSALQHIPEIKSLSQSIVLTESMEEENNGSEPLHKQLLRHCEDIPSGTINRSDLSTAILKTCQDNGIIITP